MKSEKVLVLAAVLLASTLGASAGNAQKLLRTTVPATSVTSTNRSGLFAPRVAFGGLSITNTNSTALQHLSWAGIVTNSSTNAAALQRLSWAGIATNTNGAALQRLSWAGVRTNTLTNGTVRFDTNAQVTHLAQR